MKHLELRILSPPEKLLKILGDTEFVISNMPYITGRRDTVKLEFRRLRVFRFSDEYSVSTSENDEHVSIVLIGGKSIIRYTFRPVARRILVDIEYKGPRGWIVSKYLEEIARTLVDEADRKALRLHVGLIKATKPESSVSKKLGEISWIAKLLMRSVLVRNEVKYLGKKTFPQYLDELLTSTRVIEKYPVVLVSGDGTDARFRLLYVGGRLRGTYVAVGEKEVYDDKGVLDEIEGILRIRVYGILKPPEPIV